MEAVAAPVIEACEVRLREPELRLARTCGRVLERLAAASGTAPLTHQRGPVRAGGAVAHRRRITAE